MRIVTSLGRSEREYVRYCRSVQWEWILCRCLCQVDTNMHEHDVNICIFLSTNSSNWVYMYKLIWLRLSQREKCSCSHSIFHHLSHQIYEMSRLIAMFPVEGLIWKKVDNPNLRSPWPQMEFLLGSPKKNLNSSLHFGQAALKYCLRWFGIYLAGKSRFIYL